MPAIRPLLDLEPTHPGAHLQLGLTYLGLGTNDDAISEIRREIRLTGSSRARVDLARALARSGAKAAARDTLETVLRTVPEQQLQAIPVAAAYAALGDRDRAFQWLDKAVAGDAPQVLTL